jgi:hypothetical protein
LRVRMAIRIRKKYTLFKMSFSFCPSGALPRDVKKNMKTDVSVRKCRRTEN